MPPLSTSNVPAKVIAPVVVVFGVSPVVPALNDVTPPELAAQVGTPPARVKTCPLVPAANIVVAPAEVWYGTEPVAPPARFVAVFAVKVDWKSNAFTTFVPSQYSAAYLPFGTLMPVPPLVLSVTANPPVVLFLKK